MQDRLIREKRIEYTVNKISKKVLERAEELHRRGLTHSEIGAKLKVSHSTVSKYAKLYKWTDDIDPPFTPAELLDDIIVYAFRQTQRALRSDDKDEFTRFSLNIQKLYSTIETIATFVKMNKARTAINAVPIMREFLKNQHFYNGTTAIGNYIDLFEGHYKIKAGVE